MIVLLLFHVCDLLADAVVVGWCFDIAYHSEGNGKVGPLHHGKFQLQRVVFGMGVVYENIVGSLAVKIAIMALSACGVLGAYSMWIAVIGDVGVAIVAILNAMRVNRGSKTTLKQPK